MPVRTSLHFTPDGVSSRRALRTINIALLTEGDHQLRWRGWTGICLCHRRLIQPVPCLILPAAGIINPSSKEEV